MKISYNWLKDYISINETPERIAEALTAIGLEVESIEENETVKGGLKGVVVGEVMECLPHPDADKLRVTKVNVGNDELLQIVCGAPNVATGQKVPVATIGTTLYFSSGDEIKIKKSKLRGVESQGMICAEDELGIGTSHDGIMVLDAQATIGAPLRELLSLDSDIIFEIGLTPNRIDAASHIGVARDLAAYLRIPVTKPAIDKFTEGKGKGISVEIENTEACPRYSGITINNITVKSSPEWLQKRLTAIGLRPINNVVDVTNFVLHEIGQPLHAFNADTIDQGKVIVKTCAEGFPFVTLDGVERKLSNQDLMICNATQPMCIAGVFGGLHNGVDEKTKNIFLESAYFNPVWIRKTARRHGLKTDASFRYERGADPQITLYALKRAALLIQEVAGGEIAGTIVDVYPTPITPCSLQLSFDNITRLIGKKIDKETIADILKHLDFEITNQDENGLQVTVPTYRVDVLRECDVVEEILRIYGYNNIEIPTHSLVSSAHSQQPDKEKLQNTISDYLVANSFYECMNNSLTKSDYYKTLETFSEKHLVRVLNPLSNDLNAMRQTLLFGGLETISHNVNRQNSDLKLFEWGNCYFFKPDKNDGSLRAYSEAQKLALFVTGFTSPQNWSKPQERSTFFYLKGFVESILQRHGINIYNLETTDAPAELFTDGVNFLINGEIVATIGSVAKKIRGLFDIKQEVFVAEISGNLLLKAAKKHRIQFEELPKFPETRRDLALLVDEKITFGQLRDTAFKTEKHLLLRVNLFDVYRGEKLPQGKKQYALSFVLQDKEKTLTDQNIERIMSNLLKAFEKEFSATLR